MTKTLFSPLADADQAVFPGLEEDKVKQDHTILEAKGNLSGTGGCGRGEKGDKGKSGTGARGLGRIVEGIQT